MKTPPLLLGTTLLFWGWQTGFPIVGAVLGAVLESARFVKLRWDLADEDFSRIWTFCVVLALAAGLYAFATSDGPASFGKLFNGANAAEKQGANNSTIHTATALLRWLPMVMFLFVAAQTFSTRAMIPLHRISFILQRRLRLARKAGGIEPPRRDVDVTYPYFILCLFSASVHPNEGSLTFFWGECALMAWALWTQRSRRFGWPVWAGILLVGVALGFSGQYGLWKLERMVENYSPAWAERLLQRRTDPLKSVTAMGRIGRLKLSGAIVIRLKPRGVSAPPTYLREASYRNYHSQIWRTGGTRDDFQVVSPEHETTWVLLSKTNTATVRIASYLYGGKALLPLPTGSGRLENLNAFTLQANSEGAVLAEGPGLVLFDAFYGPGATIDSPPDTNLDLFVPSEEKPALDQVIAEMKLSDQDEMKTRLAVGSFFSKQFQYSLWQEADTQSRSNETVLARFLLRTRSGHCEFFATATVLLLRELGIPARYGVGYAVHEASGKGYVVRERDAHAWCLVWDKQAGTWVDFDTTPGSWVEAEKKRAS
ncbi:MAG: transglutaminase-like domain-containing protein, partial [Verrucomicrobiota bacterium]